MPPTVLPPTSGSSVLPPPGYPSTYSGAPSTGYPSAGYGAVAPSTLYPTYPGMGPSGSIGAYSGTTPPGYPPTLAPNSTPPSLYPGSMFGSTNPYSGYGAVNNGAILAPGAVGGASTYNAWNPQSTLNQSMPFIPFCQGPRFRQTFLYGNNDPDSLQINDSDVSLAFALPHFLFSTQPVYILPSFSLHLWDGPKNTAADLPATAYSAFIDTGWQSDPMRLAGAELGLRVGVFTAFDTYDSDSWRIMGRALGRLRLTPTATLKAGIVYLDRNQIKLLPAGGVLWQPNPNSRFDIFFPEPKLSSYLNTFGNLDTWWYMGGYYGGGTWTITRTDGAEDSVDINDIRIVLGFEWGRNDQLREGRRIGFFEAGYVFERELAYRYAPQDNIDLQNTFVIRAGFGY